MKTKNETADVGVIVGRFQLPSLHEAHLDLIQKVTTTHPRVLLFLGLSPCKCTFNNPLDFQTRKKMILQKFPDVEVHYIEDMQDDNLWSNKLDSEITKLIGPKLTVLLYGGRDSFICHYHGKFKTEELVPTVFVSGKEIRKNVGIKSKDTPEFREGVIWAVENQYSAVLPTVDIAIYRKIENDFEILLGRKPNELGYRFIGGFASTQSENYEQDAKREVIEETGLEVGTPKYLFSALVNDWRYRGEQNKIKTLFFIAQYVFGTPHASDDIAEVKWFKYSTLTDEVFVETHKQLFYKLFDSNCFFTAKD
jgi:bifunctional NMN adenylyltransferase/nudix hydrolase